MTALLAADVAELIANSLRSSESDSADQLVTVNEILALSDGAFASDILVALGGAPALKPPGEIPDAHDAFCAMAAGGAKRAASAAGRLIDATSLAPAEDPDYLKTEAAALRQRVRLDRAGRTLTILIQDASGSDVEYGWAWGRLTEPRCYSPGAADRAVAELALSEKVRRDRGIAAQLQAKVPDSSGLMGDSGIAAGDRAQLLLSLARSQQADVVDAWAKCIVGDLNLAFHVGHDPSARAAMLDETEQLVKAIGLAGYLPQLYAAIAEFQPPGHLADDALGVLTAILNDDGTVTPLRQRIS